nr:putative ribonuclease H-like domain-containing protein [Tanacetum cinerariifolium]
MWIRLHGTRMIISLDSLGIKGRKPKRLKDSAYHKEKMLLCKQAEQGVSLQAEQYDWLADTDEEVDEQKLEAHYSYMGKIQEVPTADSGTDSEPLEHVRNNAGYNVFANDLQHSEQSEIISNTCLVETDDSNVIPDSPDMCEDNIQNDQNDVESNDEHKTKVITDLKFREEYDIDKMLSMEKQLKFLNEIVYKRSQSIQTIHMMEPKVPTYNGRPTFANPRYLKQAQSEIPCLYAFPYDQSTHANRLILDGEEIIALERESRSKLNKDLVRPYDYTTLNSLYENFKPPTQEFKIQLAHANEIKKKMWRKSFVKYKLNIYKNVGFLSVSKSISKSRQAYNVMTNNINHFKEIVDNAWIKHSKDQFRAPTAQDMEILIQTCLMPFAIKTQNDSFIFVHEFKIHQYLQNEHYALWEVIEFGDSYEAPLEESYTGSASESSVKKKGMTAAITTEDMQKRRNDVKVRTTLLLALPDEHQLRFSKYKSAQELWAEGSETLDQTFNRLQAIVSHLEFIDVEIERDDLNQKFLTSLAPEWLMYTIMWRNRNDLDTLSLDDVYNHLKVYEPEVQKKSESNSHNMAFISSANTSSGKGTDVAGFDKSKVECFNCHKMGHFARECRAPRSQDRGRRENYKQGSKVEESAPKALMAIDGVGWDWSYMANEEENHALVADDEAPTEFALTAKSSSSFENKEGLGYSVVPPLAQVYSPPKKDMSWTRLPEFTDDTITDYNRPSPSIESNSSDLQNSNSSVSEHGKSSESIMSKPMIKFVTAADSPTIIKTNKVETVRKPSVKYAEMYRNTSKSPKEKAVKALACWIWRPKQNTTGKGPNRNSVSVIFKKYQYIDTQGRLNGCSRHMTGNISYLSDYEPYDGGYVAFGQGGGKITGKECIVLGRDFKLKDDTNVLLRTPRQHNMYSIDLNNIVPHKDLTCLVAKASVDESMLSHRRLGHLNFKTMNKLVRHNLVKGLPSKCFENDHTCVACLKGKQHKASCKTKLVNSMSKPLHTLHMDLFGPTSISSLNRKWYCLVVTDDFSRFTWTFFLKTKDETSGILRNFITEIENLKELKVKIIKYDNGGEFKNKEMDDFCTRKGIKREFSNTRTPQQNGVAKRRNRTLIEAARTMLADAKLPVTFWAEAVNTACYVQNRVLVNKSQNKTPYELFNSRTPAIGFLRPFGCHVMILNTLDNLGKFDAKGDEGYFIGYSMSNKAFRVFNKRSKKVEENLHVDFLENKLNEKGAGPNWLFDIDTLTNFMNYVTVDVARTSSTNFSGTKDVASQDVKKDVSSLRYIALPNWFYEAHLESSTMESAIPTVSSPIPTACLDDSPETSSDTKLISKRVTSQDDTPSLDNILTLSNRFEDILGVTSNTVDTNGVEADLSNMESIIPASPTPTFRIHKDHPKSQIIGPEELLQFKIQNVWILVDYPKGVRSIGIKWVLKNKKDERGIVIRNKAILVAQGHTQEEGIDYEEVFAPVARIEAIRLFLAYASFMGFTVYQVDVKSAFLYGTIDEEVYVMQPPRFQDLVFLDRVYKVEKAMYGLHQAPRAWYGTLSKYLLAYGFKRGTIDQTLFIRKHRGDFLLVQVYVDDIILDHQIYSCAKNLNP